MGIEVSCPTPSDLLVQDCIMELNVHVYQIETCSGDHDGLSHMPYALSSTTHYASTLCTSSGPQASHGCTAHNGCCRGAGAASYCALTSCVFSVTSYRAPEY